MTRNQETQLHLQLSTAHTSFQKGLNARAFFKLQDRAVGEDLVQDTFLKTWKYLLKGGEIVIMKAFLYHILNNLIIDQYRKNKTTSLDILLEKGFEPSDDESSRFLKILDGKSAVAHIAGLPKMYKKILGMRFIENLTIKEISSATGQTKNAIAVQVHRGLEKLKVSCGYSH